jgi:hypothetical protein
VWGDTRSGFSVSVQHDARRNCLFKKTDSVQLFGNSVVGVHYDHLDYKTRRVYRMSDCISYGEGKASPVQA